MAGKLDHRITCEPARILDQYYVDSVNLAVGQKGGEASSATNWICLTLRSVVEALQYQVSPRSVLNDC